MESTKEGVERPFPPRISRQELQDALDKAHATLKTMKSALAQSNESLLRAHVLIEALDNRLTAQERISAREETASRLEVGTQWKGNHRVTPLPDHPRGR